ncbi:MAG: hypothetical protein Q9227_008334 [Pyrenula ochraceoflavens]
MGHRALEQPLKGIRVLELAGLAPGPFAGLLLADLGASVLRIDRPSSTPSAPTPDLLTRHKRSITLNLKDPRSRALFITLISQSDILIDPYRPGVLESLSLDPHSVLLKHNPRLIIVQLTGFRRDDPKYGRMAGHDINYLAVNGVLDMLGEKGGRPSPPGNVLADFAGGGLVAACGALTALFSRERNGKGQVVDANMVDGAGALGTFMRLAKKTSMWDGRRGENMLDGGCPYYGTYEVMGGGYVAVGALEPQFFSELLRGLGLKQEEVLMPGINDRSEKEGWEYMRGVFEKRFMQKTRQEWEKTFDGTDACVTPVLTHEELETAGYEQRGIVGLSVTPGCSPNEAEGKGWVAVPMQPGERGEDALMEWLGWRKGRDFEDQNGFLVQTKSDVKSRL